MASRLIGIGLAAAVAASSLTGCMTRHSYEASKKKADEAVLAYISNPELRQAQYIPPVKNEIAHRMFSPSTRKLEECYPDLFDSQGLYRPSQFFMEEQEKPEPLLHIYDPCTGGYNIPTPSESRIISWSFNQLVNSLREDNPIRVSRDHVNRVTTDFKGWVRERTGGELKESGIGFSITWRY
jgi:hypothetical protein